MDRIPRRVPLPFLVPLTAVWIACGEAPTTPLVVEIAAPAPAYSVVTNGEGVCSQPRSAGFVDIPGDSPGLFYHYYCFSMVLTEGVAFMSVLSDPEATTHQLNPVWLYQAGDTLPEVGLPVVGPMGPAGGEVICGGFTCTYEPQQSGRVYFTFTIRAPPTNISFDIWSWSPILWVGDSDPDSLKIVCMPAVVVRGQSLNCTASVDPPGPTLTVQEWHFSGASGSRTEPSSSTTWSGIMVESGVVEVDAYVDGALLTASAHVVVAPRDWSNVAPTFAVTELSPGPLNLPNPTRIGQFGGVGFRPTGEGVLSALKDVPSGPNRGLHYLTTLPYGIEATVHVNTIALSTGSAFWANQPNRQSTNAAGQVMCSKRDVVPFAAVVRKHEGIGLASGSHARFYRDSLFQIAGPGLEDIVGAEPFHVLTQAKVAFEAAMSGAKSASAKADQGSNIPSYCLFTGIMY